MLKNLSIVTLFCGVLAACGGGGSSGGVVLPVVPATDTSSGGTGNLLSFADSLSSGSSNSNLPLASGPVMPLFNGIGSGLVMESTYPRLFRGEFENVEADIGALTSMPTGSASYQGLFIMTDPSDVLSGFIGNSDVTINYSADSFGGAVGDIGYYRDRDGNGNTAEFPALVRSVGGTLSLSGQSTVASSGANEHAAILEGQISGNLTNGGSALTVGGSIYGFVFTDGGRETVVIAGDSEDDPSDPAFIPTTIDDGSGAKRADLVIMAN